RAKDMRTDANDLPGVGNPALELLLNHTPTLTDEWWNRGRKARSLRVHRRTTRLHTICALMRSRFSTSVARALPTRRADPKSLATDEGGGGLRGLLDSTLRHTNPARKQDLVERRSGSRVRTRRGLRRGHSTEARHRRSRARRPRKPRVQP